MSSANPNTSGQPPHMPPHLGQDFQLFEMVTKDDYFSVIVNSQSLRTAHYEFLSQIRLTDFQNRYDTITVSEKLVADAKHFFKLMSTVTSERAFQEQLNFTNRSGRAQIDSPTWVDKVDSAYLTVWIASLLEENLWAHYNYAHNANVEKNVRKNDITNLFETRSETLQSQEVLAKHWHDIGNKGRQRLIEKLRQKAKEIQIVPQDQSYLFGAEQYFAFEQAYSNEFGGSPFGQDETSRYYATPMGLSRGYLNYNGLPHDQMAEVFASQAGSPSTGPPSSSHPFGNQMSAGASQQMGMRPYQFYHLSDIPMRPQQYARMYQDQQGRDQLQGAPSQPPPQFQPGGSADGLPSAVSAAAGAQNKSQKEPVVPDPDLKQITSYILQKESVVSSMDVIKFLSETPLDEMSHFALPDKTRKNTLCRELLAYIQDDLRNHIQNQLILEEPTASSLHQFSQGGSSHLGSSAKTQGSSQSAQSNQASFASAKNATADAGGGGQGGRSQEYGAVTSQSQAEASKNAQTATTGGGKKRRKNRRKGAQTQAIVIQTQDPQTKPSQHQQQKHQTEKGRQMQGQEEGSSYGSKGQSNISGQQKPQSSVSQSSGDRDQCEEKNAEQPQPKASSTTQSAQGLATGKKLTTMTAVSDEPDTSSTETNPPQKPEASAKGGSQKQAHSSSMRFNKKTQPLESDSKSQRATTAGSGYGNLRHAATDAKQLKSVVDTDDETGDKRVAQSDPEDAEDMATKVSLRSVDGGRKAFAGNDTLGEAATTLDTKTTTNEAGQFTTSGSQSARKEHNNMGGANLLQLTASQSVDLIKPSEQMRDELESKAFSTKSSTELTVASQSAANQVSAKEFGGQKQNNINGEKNGQAQSSSLAGTSKKSRGGREPGAATNPAQKPRRKKRNTSSNSRSKHQGSRSISADSSPDDVDKAALAHEFVEQLVERAWNIATAEEACKAIASVALSARKQEEATMVQEVEAEEEKKQAIPPQPTSIKTQHPQPQQQQQPKIKNLASMDPEDLGVILARQKSKMQAQQQKQLLAQQKQQQSSQKNSNPIQHTSKVSTTNQQLQHQHQSTRKQNAKKVSLSPQAKDKAQQAPSKKQHKGDAQPTMATASIAEEVKSSEQTTLGEPKPDNQPTPVSSRKDRAATAAKQLSEQQSDSESQQLEKDSQSAIEESKTSSNQAQSRAKAAAGSTKQDHDNTSNLDTEDQSAQGAQNKRKRKRNTNRKKPNDKLEAMNSFLLKMHGDGPASTSTSAQTQGSNQNKANNNRQGGGAQQRRQNEEKAQAQASNGGSQQQQTQSNNGSARASNNREAQGAQKQNNRNRGQGQGQGQAQQSQAQQQQQQQHQKVSPDDRKGKAASAQSSSASSAAQPTNVKGSQGAKTSSGQATEDRQVGSTQGSKPSDSFDEEPPTITEMQKYASFTVNDSNQQEFLSIPSTIPVTQTDPSQREMTGSEQEQQSPQPSSSVDQAAMFSPSNVPSELIDSEEPLLLPKPQEPRNSKREKLDIKIDLSQAQQKIPPEKSPNEASQQPRLPTKQKSPETTEKAAQPKGSESARESKKLASKEQMESAKADFRARFIELEKQNTAQYEDRRGLSLNEEFKGSRQQKSAEQVAVNVECVDLSRGQVSAEKEDRQRSVDAVGSPRAEHRSSDGEQDQSSDPEQSESINVPDQLESASNISASEASASSKNPFMSVKAQSFMPTAFVPSPNKSPSQMVIPPGSFSPDFSPVKGFTQAPSSQQPSTALGISGMPFKSLSVMDVPKEDVQGSARSGGSASDAAPVPDAGFSPSAAAGASTNPFKQPGQVHLQKTKSVQVDGFGRFAQNVATSGQHAHGFKVPDSSSPFAFQPHNSGMPFGPSFGGSGGGSTFVPGVSHPAEDAHGSHKGGNFGGGHHQWDGGKDRGDKPHYHNPSSKQMDGGQGEGHTSTKKKSGPFNRQSQKLANQDGAGGSNFGDFDGGGKPHYHKSKTQYQAINRSSNERPQHQLQFGEDSKPSFKGKNNRMHLDFDHMGRDASNNQHSPLQAPYSNRRYSGDKKSNKKGGQQLDQKGPRNPNRFKNTSKGSLDRMSHTNDDEFYNERAPQKQDSQDSQLSDTPASLPLGHLNSYQGGSSSHDPAWQTTHRTQSFTPGGFNNPYQSPVQYASYMATNPMLSNPFGLGGRLGFDQLDYPQNEEESKSGLGSSTTSTYLAHGTPPTDREESQAYVARRAADSTLLQSQLLNFPKEEDIIARAGLVFSNLDLENLPVVEQDCLLDEQAKAQMEADPVYKLLEDRFYKVFDQHILDHTSRITAKIQDFTTERDYVRDQIEAMARRDLNCEKIVAEVFGSLITGLALESSDMDIVINGLEISDRSTLIEDMHTLARALDDWDLIHDLKSIETASIPVIKAKIDLIKIRKLLREQKAAAAKTQNNDTSGDNQQQSDDDRKQNESEDQNPEEGADERKTTEAEDEFEEPRWLPIDITFDDSQSNPTVSGPSSFEPPSMMQMDPFGLNFGLGILGGLTGTFGNQNGFGGFNAPKDPYGPPTVGSRTHLGIKSCELLSEYTATYPCLREVGILLKEFLSLHDLNSAYRGGISSYSAMLLIVAYMNNFKLQKSPHITPSRLLMGFLDFYSNCFDPKLYGVNTLLDMSFYAQTPQNQQMFVIVDPVNPSNNSARNSHRTPEILKKFQEAFTHLKSLVWGEYQRLQQLKDEQAASLAREAAAGSPTGKDMVDEADKGRSDEGDEQRQESTEAGASGKPAKQGEESGNRRSAVDGCTANEAIGDFSDSPAAGESPTQAAQQEQQQLPPDSAETSAAAGQSAGAAPTTDAHISSSSQHVLSSSTTFTPQKSQASAAFVAGDGTLSQQVPDELPEKPFFFASVDLIAHFLSTIEETSEAPASPGESRPGGGVGDKTTDDDAQARSGGPKAAK